MNLGVASILSEREKKGRGREFRSSVALSTALMRGNVQEKNRPESLFYLFFDATIDK